MTKKKNEEEKNSSNDFIGERMNFLLNGIWVHEMNSVTFVWKEKEHRMVIPL